MRWRSERDGERRAGVQIGEESGGETEKGSSKESQGRRGGG